MNELQSRPATSPTSGEAGNASAGGPGKQSLTSDLQQAGESPGSPLPEGMSSRLGNALGADVSNVRVHTGEASAKAADGLQANAFAVGQAVHFGAGKYQPGTPDGDRLIAHEVAHTVQQQGAKPGAEMEVSSPGDGHEQAAEGFAQKFASGGGADAGPAAAAAPVGKGTVSRSMIHRDPTPGATTPGPVATPGAPAAGAAAATPVDKTAAQNALLDYRERAGSFITGNHNWLTQNWTYYLSRTTQNPMLGWADGTAASVVSNALGNLLTELGQNLIKRGSAAAAGALVGSAIAPGAGTVIGFVVGVLVESAASMIFEALTGKSDAAAAANAASRRTGDLIQAQYGNLATANANANAELNAGYRSTQTALTNATDQTAVDRIRDWANSEKAKVEHPAPIADRSLAQQMIREWVLEHAGDEEDANSSTDETEWEAARDEAFGEGDLDYHREIFAYQTRHEWGKAGLNVAQAQAIIDDVMAMRRGADGITQSISTQTAYNRYNGRRYTLPVADSTKWGQYWRQHKSRPTSTPHRRGWEAAAAMIDAGQFTVDCTLDLTTADMSCYVDEWDYEIVLTGDPPMYWRQRNPFSVSPD